MSPERWQKITDVFQAALAREAKTRAAFVADACADDSELKQEVEKLLAAHDEADGFIESLAVKDAAGLLSGNHDGKIFGHYKILRKIGEGGMGEVFAAEDTKLGRKAALKILPAEFTGDAERLRRFRQEARAVSALNHPNILTIYEIGENDDEMHFIATEFIDGETLREKIERRSKLFLTEALEIAAQMASALKAAHASSVIHRDIKPENIMSRRDGIVKILDFGLAKLTEHPAVDSEEATREMVKTRAGLVMGTVQYMSPEQTRGLEKVDARTDIWSLGVCLYEMMAGRTPFGRETMSDTIAAILTAEPEAIEIAPPELQKILDKSLRKNATERYQSAGEMLEDLQALKQEITLAAHLERSGAPDSKKRQTANEQAALAVANKQVVSRAEYIVGEIKRHKRGAWLVSATLILLSIGVISFFYLSKATNEKTPIQSIAVLPFENASGDANNEYLSDGITESLINSLSILPDVKVIARASVFRYKGKEINPSKIAEELNVQALMTGRIVQQGDTLSISVSLDNARDNTHLWGEQFTRKTSDIFAVQSEIARQVTNALRVKLNGAENAKLTKQYTNNEEAYKLYLQGRYQWNKRTGESLKKAVEYYKQAIEKDPNFALAYASLGETYCLFPGYSVALPDESFPKAKEAIDKALALDENLAEAHNALSSYKGGYLFDNYGSERESLRAIELNPNYATAHHWYGSGSLAALQRWDEALAEMHRAQELDPLSVIISTDTAFTFYMSRRYDEAIAQFQRTLALDPNFYFAHWELAAAYHQKRMYREAIEEYQKAIRLNDDPWVRAMFGRTLAKSGNRAEASKILEQLKTETTHRYVPSVCFVALYSALGDNENAFGWLEKDFTNRESNPRTYDWAPYLDDLRGDARFAEFVKRAQTALPDKQ
jgi:serine/threonine protein kinase/Tfp pilus assembly protein PilF